MTKYAVKDADYLDLWKYFQERADSLKESMFQSVTWILGFAAAVLGFILTSFVTLEASTIVLKYRGLAILSCAIGVVLCLYALFLLKEFAEHIQRNWRRAAKCEAKVDVMDVKLSEPEEPKTKWWQIWRKKWQIWEKIGVIVVLFATAFIVMAIMFATI